MLDITSSYQTVEITTIHERANIPCLTIMQ